jgi:hypothetical protein
VTEETPPAAGQRRSNEVTGRPGRWGCTLLLLAATDYGSELANLRFARTTEAPTLRGIVEAGGVSDAGCSVRIFFYRGVGVFLAGLRVCLAIPGQPTGSVYARWCI